MTDEQTKADVNQEAVQESKPDPVEEPQSDTPGDSSPQEEQAQSDTASPEPVKDQADGAATRLPVNISVFTGPLDLLVHLIAKKELDIFSVSLTEITDEYLKLLREVEHKDLDVAGEYLVLSATLIRHKARALLPKEEIEPEEEEIADHILEMRRKEYERFRAIADDLRTREEMSSAIFPRQGRAPEGKHEVVEYDEVSIYDLHQTFKKIIDEIGARPPDAVEGETFSVDEKMMEIEAILSHNDKIILTNYLSNLKTKLEVIVVFLALLELIRLQEVIAKQDKNHGEIVLHKGKQFHQTGQEEENRVSDDNESLDA